MITTISVNQVPIRLTDERWEHIINEHAEMGEMREQILQTVANPERILAGGTNELLAVREVKAGKWLVAVYKEQEIDGFIIPAFLTRRVASLNRRQQLWP